jgi:hypothetical protein
MTIIENIREVHIYLKFEFSPRLLGLVPAAARLLGRSGHGRLDRGEGWRRQGRRVARQQLLGVPAALAGRISRHEHCNRKKRPIEVTGSIKVVGSPRRQDHTTSGAYLGPNKNQQAQSFLVSVIRLYVVGKKHFVGALCVRRCAAPRGGTRRPSFEGTKKSERPYGQ